jgi:acyl transferase domain-containing protein
MYQGLFRAHFLSPSGQCKAFDSAADGYCRAEGSGLFVLKRLKDAVAENDRIYGVIRGIEVNQCGNAHSITHPHQQTQQALFRKLLDNTAIPPASVGVVEAHGTGTQAGDAAEISSIEAVFHRPRDTPLYVTSVKANMGHAEAASGAAGLAKLLLMLREKKIPQQIEIKDLNPRMLDAAQRGIAVARKTERWSSIGPRRALLNNFGAAGSNSALLLEEHVTAPSSEAPHRSAYPFIISAKSEVALKQLSEAYLRIIIEKHEASIQNICYTATARRERHQYQLPANVRSLDDLQSKLRTHQTILVKNPSKKPIIFTFSGQGATFSGMGRELLSTSPIFADAVQRCDELLTRWEFPSVRPMIDGSYKVDLDFHSVIVSQCSCFVLQYALSQLLRSYNIVPDLVFGHR